MSSSLKFKYSVKILFPIEEYNKRLRFLGIINKNIIRPIGVYFLTLLKDYDIINWFSFKTFSIWKCEILILLFF